MTTEYAFHPLCEAYPRMTDDLYAARRADYQRHPGRAAETAVVLAVDPADGAEKIADGRHHYLLCRELGYECRFERFDGTPEDLAALVEARNANRRHQTPSQIAASLAATAKWLGRWGRGGDRGNQHTGGKTARAVLPPQDQVAEQHGISADTLQRAAKVAEKAPDLLPAVRDGKLDAKTAAKVADLPKKQRAKVASAPDPKAAAKAAVARAKAPSLAPEVEERVVAAVRKGMTDHDAAAVCGCSPADVKAVRKRLAEGAKAAPRVEPAAQPAVAPAADAWGIPVQPHAAEAFAAVPKFKEILALLYKVRGELTPLAESPGGRLLLRRCQFVKSANRHGGRWVLAELDNAIGVLEDATPRHTDCPYHFNTFQPHADDAAGRPCPLCDNRRFTGDLRRFQVPPDLLAAMRAHYGVGGPKGGA